LFLKRLSALAPQAASVYHNNATPRNDKEMSDKQASAIPNLLSLRGARGGRGRGRGGSIAVGNGGPSSASKDKIVQQTDNDASLSRMSAVSLGYLDDPFAHQFVQGEVPKRYPIINRGTYVRTAAIDELVNRFLASDVEQQKQIISLGAGSDTRYFRLVSNNPSLKLVYHELDFATNNELKIAAIKKSPELLKVIHVHLQADSDAELQIAADGTSLQSPVYNIHAIDLRTLATSEPRDIPKLPSVSPSLPTLLLSECCLIYLPPQAADAVLKAFTTHFISPSTPLSTIIYEPIRPFDSFGQVMISNLAQRGIVLQTLQKYSSLAAQKARMRIAGLTTRQEAADVDFIMKKWVSQEEKDRVAKCEMLDELEEWMLLAQHYCVAWGWRDGGGDLFLRAWSGLPLQPDDGGDMR
jgi:[phosphatase 2A protein]-leucine-carboxy methyltransferase